MIHLIRMTQGIQNKKVQNKKYELIVPCFFNLISCLGKAFLINDQIKVLLT